MTSKAKKGNRKSGYIAAIIINIILIYVFNNLMNWGVPFLTERFSAVLWAINISLSATILANVIYLLADINWLRHTGEIILTALAIFVLFMILVIFPFTFAEESWAFWVRVGLIIAMVGTGIGLIVEIFKLILGKE